MSSELAITVQDITKTFEIYERPLDRLKQGLFRGRHNFYSEFHALKGISFEVCQGSTVAIIGSNGAGKSTLLQLICGTLTPTSGEINVTGRVAALLELGAGFNPEFTGRENVYLSAGILGLSRSEINARIDQIEAFADIGNYIDQPVKSYSSGMYVRLAFAVIAHVDADILIVDEALSVGDAVFTQKCMRYIRAFQEKGTLLFVSHDMGAVQNLCETAIWLDHGEVRLIGKAKEVTDKYFQFSLQKVYGESQQLRSIDKKGSDAGYTGQEDDASGETDSSYTMQLNPIENLDAANGWMTGAGEITAVHIQNMSNDREVFEGGETVKLVIEAKLNQDMINPLIGFFVKDRLGQDLFGENTLPFSASMRTTAAAGQSIRGEFVFTLPMLPNGQYVVMASLADGDLVNNVQHHVLHDAYVLNVSSSTVRWGLVGVKFKSVSLGVIDD